MQDALFQYIVIKSAFAACLSAKQYFQVQCPSILPSVPPGLPSPRASTTTIYPTTPVYTATAVANHPSNRYPIHHSDRGSQYCCWDYVKELKNAGFSISITEHKELLIIILRSIIRQSKLNRREKTGVAGTAYVRLFTLMVFISISLFYTWSISL